MTKKTRTQIIARFLDKEMNFVYLATRYQVTELEIREVYEYFKVNRRRLEEERMFGDF